MVAHNSSPLSTAYSVMRLTVNEELQSVSSLLLCFCSEILDVSSFSKG